MAKPATAPTQETTVPTSAPTAKPVQAGVQITDEQRKAVKAMTTKAAQMRYLHGLGLKTGPIAKLLTEIHGKTVLYQHVRNQLNQPLKTK